MNVDYIIGSLLEKDLITIKGRAEVVGRPMLYGTTDNLLEYLGINSIEDLPQLKAIDEIIKSGPPEGVSQSDIDFYEEINQIREKMVTGGNAAASLITEVNNENSEAVIHELPVEESAVNETEESSVEYINRDNITDTDTETDIEKETDTEGQET